MSGPAELHVRLASAQEREELEALQWRASLENDNDREALLANPDAIELPIEQIEDGRVLVAELGGAIAGFAVVLPEESHAELDGLFVEPGLWRRGIAKVLVDAATHEARRMGLSLLCVIANPAARGFYEKVGFSGEELVETRFGPGLRMSR